MGAGGSKSPRGYCYTGKEPPNQVPFLWSSAPNVPPKDTLFDSSIYHTDKSRAPEDFVSSSFTLNLRQSVVLCFLTELTRLFQKCRTSGSVFITLKKYDGRTKPVPRKGHVESFEPADNKCLLRATDGKKKISTVVSSKEVNKFQMAYSNLLRANMDGLKKKDKKSKNKKSKATQ
ncbi:PREDICTED: signal recognition particle 14 kDa protein [Tinamus guttatus]|uniref:signal recognition particle 14 kDa protein n=1 Tax=Tinamus guttatus TaxID=94827 RepID=UPI00052F217A|nr:PREDICTED: signal recognition particle 14 kDa protein [Tinamus guttatus]